MQSWVNLINSQGGLRCHPVRYLVDDDGGDPARHMALVRKQVEQEQILAFVYMDAGLNGRTSVKYITDKRVPVIGDETGSDWFYESPMYFPQATSGLSTTEAVVAMGADIGKPQNKTKLALLTCVEADVCRQTASNGEAWAKKYGLTLSYRGQVSLGQPDFTAECLAARNAGSELLYVVVEAASLRRAATSCDRVDFHPIYMVTGGQSDVSLAKDPNLDGLAVSLIVRPWFLTGAPAVAEHQAVMVKYGVEPGPQTMVGWVAAKLFELATQKLAEPPTRESVLDGLWSVKNNDLGGLTYPMTFTRDQNAPRVLCYWQTRTKAGEWVSPDAGARQCR